MKHCKKPCWKLHSKSSAVASQYTHLPVRKTVKSSLPIIFSTKPNSGDYQKTMPSMFFIPARISGQTCDAEPTTAMYFVSTMVTTQVQVNRIFQPYGNGEDARSYQVGAKDARLRPGDRAAMRGTLHEQTIELENGTNTTVNHFSVTFIEVISRSKRTSITAYEKEKLP
jgi:hypothetical protein